MFKGILFLWLPLFSTSTQEIASTILDTKAQLEEDALFLSFWNFDDTLFNGDTTEGTKDIYGNVLFKGLAQVAIESGYSKKYPAKGGFPRFWKDYQNKLQKDEPAAYAYCAQILAGSKEKDILQLSTQYFESTLRKYFFHNTVELMRTLQQNGIEIYIITASPKIFVQGASNILNIPLDHFQGMETEVRNGVLTDRLIYPLSTRQGKVEHIQQIVKKLEEQNKKVYILFGIGNHNYNDMVFLKWIAAQELPKGNPLSVVGYIPPVVTEENMVTLPEE